MLAPAVVAVPGDLLAVAGLVLAALADGELVPAEWALALTECEHEDPVRPSAIRTAMIPAILRMTR
jgi:hypothetical protein